MLGIPTWGRIIVGADGSLAVLLFIFAGDQTRGGDFAVVSEPP